MLHDKGLEYCVATIVAQLECITRATVSLHVGRLLLWKSLQHVYA